MAVGAACDGAICMGVGKGRVGKGEEGGRGGGPTIIGREGGRCCGIGCAYACW